MCGRCEGEPYRGVTSLFAADFQAVTGFVDRAEWLAVSGSVLVFVGESKIEDNERPLVRDCSASVNDLLTEDELLVLGKLSVALSRPVNLPDELL